MQSQTDEINERYIASHIGETLFKLCAALVRNLFVKLDDP
jgi:hypothetical protein